ncbi:MAG: SUMF1/EgtB/PvdO family nonheme iron enzyme, partial [Bacteroidetes bacterium]|nr:SUMF1/EgtB/PvdO family nonheme iron enzyme [Bacteroidota bacterium]
MYRKFLLLASVMMALYQPFANAQQKSSNQPEMVFIEGGTFSMGSNTGSSDEKPMHEVFVDNYSIGKYEVTIGEFRRFVKDSRYITDAEKLA